MLNELMTSKILTNETIVSLLTFWRLKSKRIVFTNGCFDILHFGHLSYLNAAKDLGTALFVGVNSDDSVKRLNKGAERPINNEKSRAFVLASLHAVDAVMVFNEDTPAELISLVRPDILVKGGDYQPKNIVGYDFVTSYGGSVLTLPLVDGYSTTSIVNKLKNG